MPRESLRYRAAIEEAYGAERNLEGYSGGGPKGYLFPQWALEIKRRLDARRGG